MAGFLDRAKEQAQRGLAQGKQKYDDVQTQRAGGDALKKLGAAYYAERHGTGSPAATQQALAALEAHIATHGDGVLRAGPSTGPTAGPSTGPTAGPSSGPTGGPPTGPSAY